MSSTCATRSSWAARSAAGSPPRWRRRMSSRIARLVLVEPLRHQARRPRRPRHRRYLVLAAAKGRRRCTGTIPRAAGATSPASPTTRSPCIARNREILRALLLGALHAQSQARRIGSAASARRPARLGRAATASSATDYAKGYAQADPRRELATIPDAGHYPHLEQPELFVAPASARSWARRRHHAEPGTSPKCPIRIIRPTSPSTRINLPNKHFDPKIGADLYNRYLDEHVIADELGLDIMLNEHHQTPSCIDTCGAAHRRDPRAPDQAGAHLHPRQPGRPPQRSDPRRRGDGDDRLHLATAGSNAASCAACRTRSSPPTPTRPDRSSGCGTASISCIKAWTHDDGALQLRRPRSGTGAASMSGRGPTRRPHPQIWITGSNDQKTPRRCAERGYVFATFLLPHEQVKPLFDAYRERFVEHGLPGGGGVAYMPLVHTADTEARPRKAPRSCAGICTASRSEPHFRNPPGYMPVPVDGRRRCSRRRAAAVTDLRAGLARPICASRASSCPARPTRSRRRSSASTTASAASTIC